MQPPSGAVSLVVSCKAKAVVNPLPAEPQTLVYTAWGHEAAHRRTLLGIEVCVLCPLQWSGGNLLNSFQGSFFLDNLQKPGLGKLMATTMCH